MLTRRRLVHCFGLVLACARPLGAQARPAAPTPAADASVAPADIQAIMKKVLSGAGPTPDEAKRFNDYDQAHHDVIVRSMNALRDSIMRKAAAPPPSQSTASVTISGALTGTLNLPVGAAFEVAQNASGVGFTGGIPAATVAVKVVGELKPGTYTSTNPGVSGVLTVSAAQWMWEATKGSSRDQGTFSLTITSVLVAAARSDGKAYVVHGTLAATLPAVTQSGATGTVTVTATF